MIQFLAAAVVGLVVLFGFQTQQSVTAQDISVTCEVAEENADCVSLGPIGTMSLTGMQHWASNFIHRCVDLPQNFATSSRDELSDLKRNLGWW